MSEPTYRQAVPADAPQLARISILASGGTFDLLLKGLKRGVSVEAIMTALCASDNTEYSYKHFLVAEVDGKIAGGVNALTVQARYDLAPNINPLLRAKFNFGLWQLVKFYLRARHLKGMNILKVPSRHSLHINDIAVLPEYTSRGIGKRLIQLTSERAKREKADYVSLYVWSDNVHAVKFYRSMGFVIANTANVSPHQYLPHNQSHLMLLKL